MTKSRHELIGLWICLTGNKKQGQVPETLQEDWVGINWMPGPEDNSSVHWTTVGSSFPAQPFEPLGVMTEVAHSCPWGFYISGGEGWRWGRVL